MKKCPFCAEQIQDEAIVCRFCNRNQPGVRSTTPRTPNVTPGSGKKLLGFLAVFAVFILVLYAIYGGPPSPREQAAAAGRPAPKEDSYKPLTISAAVQFKGGQFTVINSGDLQWDSARLTVNPSGFLRQGYDYKIGILKPGGSVTIGSMDFANSDGVRFNPFQVKPQTFMITANVKGQSATTTMTFN